MDLTFTEEQQAISDLTGRILAELLPPEVLREVEAGEEWFARQAWAELAKADLLGLCLPEAVGGGGYGISEACLVATEVGKTVAPLPFVATITTARAIATHGAPEQVADLLPGVIDGTAVLTAALADPGESGRPEVAATRAVRDGAAWRLHGDKQLVPAAHLASRVLVAARTDDQAVALFLVDPRASGVTLVREETVSLEPQFTVRLDGVEVADTERVGAPDAGQAILDALVDEITVALCATAVGVCEGALRLTAAYVSEREQFGTKIGTFQAVAHRCADAYIDTEAVRLTTWQAAWRLDAGVPADEALAVAKYWAAEGSQRVVHAAQHLHGGIGMDTDYPVHRYFRWAKILELTLGGATVSLLRLGDLLAARPPGGSTASVR